MYISTSHTHLPLIRLTPFSLSLYTQRLTACEWGCAVEDRHSSVRGTFGRKARAEKEIVSPTETTETKQDGVKREISVEIPAEEVTRETEVLIQKYQKVARLPGFRAGHVPASIIRQRFKEDLKSDVVEALVPRYFRKEAEKLGMVPVSQPRVTDLHIHEGEPLRFKASFEIMPEIKVEGYKELRADHPQIEVKDEEVEEALNNVREQHATFTTIEGSPLGEGDFAQASMDGRPKDADDKTQPVHMDEVLIEIGGKNTVPEFSANLRGANAGETREFEVVYPEDIERQAAGGKNLHLHREDSGDKTKNICPSSTTTSPRSWENLPASIRCASRFARTCWPSASTPPSARPKTSS